MSSASERTSAGSALAPRHSCGERPSVTSRAYAVPGRWPLDDLELAAMPELVRLLRSSPLPGPQTDSCHIEQSRGLVSGWQPREGSQRLQCHHWAEVGLTAWTAPARGRMGRHGQAGPWAVPVTSDAIRARPDCTRGSLVTRLSTCSCRVLTSAKAAAIHPRHYRDHDPKHRSPDEYWDHDRHA